MRVAPFIAFRYLFAKKSHNVINIISAISALGMAIGTAALVIILSIYNGFDTLVRSTMSSVEPDLMITPKTSKVFTPDEDVYDWIRTQNSVKSVCCVLEEEVFVNYDEKQAVARAKGVDWTYETESPLRDYMISGEWVLQRGENAQAPLLQLRLASSAASLRIWKYTSLPEPDEFRHPTPHRRLTSVQSFP